jgi:hypothetical protein
MDADLFATDARELHRHANEPIFLFLIVGGEGLPPINFNHNLFSPPDRITHSRQDAESSKIRHGQYHWSMEL